MVIGRSVTGLAIASRAEMRVVAAMLRLENDLGRVGVQKPDHDELVLIEQRAVRSGEGAGSATVERPEPAAPDDTAADVAGSGNTDDVANLQREHLRARRKPRSKGVRRGAGDGGRDRRNCKQALHPRSPITMENERRYNRGVRRRADTEPQSEEAMANQGSVE